MQCPTDGTTLTMSERSGIEIDYCPQCRGVWLDRGELDKIIERAATEQGAWANPPAQPQAAPAPRYAASAATAATATAPSRASARSPGSASCSTDLGTTSCEVVAIATTSYDVLRIVRLPGPGTGSRQRGAH